MRKVIKKVSSLILATTLVVSAFTGCGESGNEVETTTPVDPSSMTPEEFYGVDSWESEEYEVASDDHYRNYYEVFVYSYADSNGDGIGDIQGLISKLDYIEETGFNGIWLMPIMPSTTYHKYDVIDYYDIDPQYGTMDDFKELIEECHARNINVIIDLVFNHTSSQHEWFKTATNYIKTLEAGQEPDYTVCPYANYYNFAKTEDVRNTTGYCAIPGTEYSYEGMFWSEMPDLNLDNESVRREIEDIASYWLNLGVDGFRLDASKEYWSGSVDKNIEVLSWFSDYVQSVREDAYIVSEIWEGYSSIKNYYTSGVESIFDYAAGNNSGTVIKAINLKNGNTFANQLVNMENGFRESNADYVNAPFLSNHDTGRISGFATYTEEKMKFAGAINQIMAGCTFVYYGEEVGMTGSGAAQDEDKRAPMPWTAFSGGETTQGPPNMGTVTHKFDDVADQMKDVNSIYWYYRKMLHIRSTYEEIPKGISEAIDVGENAICCLKKTYDGSSMYVLANFSNEEKTITFASSDYGYTEMVDFLVTDASMNVKIEGDSITLPAYGIAFMK